MAAEDEIDEMMKEFSGYNFEWKMRDVGLLLFKYERLFADYLALKSIVFDHIRNTTSENAEELDARYKAKFGEIFRDRWADFVVKYGEPPSSQSSPPTQ